MTRYINNSEIRFTYNVKGFVHRQTMGVKLDPTDPLPSTAVSLVKKDGTTVPVATAVTAYAALWAPIFTDQATLVSYEVWDLRNDATELPESVFVTGGSIGQVGNGTINLTVHQEVSQRTMLYRSEFGNVGRLVFLGTDGGIYQKQGRPFDTDYEALASFFESDDSWLRHPDGFAPSFFYASRSTTNNAMERRIFSTG